MTAVDQCKRDRVSRSLSCTQDVSSNLLLSCFKTKTSAPLLDIQTWSDRNDRVITKDVLVDAEWVDTAIEPSVLRNE